jgi:hypothetical protein
MHEQASNWLLGQQGALQSGGNKLLRHGSQHVPGNDVFTGYILKSTQIRLGPTGQWQVSTVADPHAVGLCNWRLVEQAVGRTAQPVRRVSGARRIGLGLQGA